VSLVASFWTIDKSKLGELVEKSRTYQKVTRKKAWYYFKKPKVETIYPWFDYLKENAKEEESFDYSGMAMIDFDLILSKASESFFEICLSESTILSEFSGGSAALLDHEAASKVIQNILSLNLTPEAVDKFYDEDEKPHEWRFEAEVLLKAGEAIKSWCQKVSPDKLGLLVIG
jgi:hypothetical protein